MHSCSVVLKPAYHHRHHYNQEQEHQHGGECKVINKVNMKSLYSCPFSQVIVATPSIGRCPLTLTPWLLYWQMHSFFSIGATSSENVCDVTKEFVCLNKRCIPNVQMCDLYPDCLDSDDESSEESGLHCDCKRFFYCSRDCCSMYHNLISEKREQRSLSIHAASILLIKFFCLRHVDHLKQIEVFQVMNWYHDSNKSWNQ